MDARASTRRLLAVGYDGMGKVTSHPVASAALRPKATRRVEVLGFTNQQFKNFISSYPYENLSALTKLIKLNQNY